LVWNRLLKRLENQAATVAPYLSRWLSCVRGARDASDGIANQKELKAAD
jgi:hypothetical protein